MSRLAVVIAVAALSLTACSGSGSATHSDSVPPTVAPSATETGNRAMAAPALLSAAKAAASAADSVHVTGTGSCDQGAFTVDMHLTRDGRGTGKVLFLPYTVQLVSTPEALFVKGDAGFWSTIVSTESATRVSGKWVRVAPAAAPCLANLGSMGALESTYLAWDGLAEKHPSSTVLGVPAQLMTVSPDWSVWVSADGAPYPIQVDEPATRTKLTFGEWGVPVTVAVPTGRDLIDGATLK